MTSPLLLYFVWSNRMMLMKTCCFCGAKFADDFSGAGKLGELRSWWDNIVIHDPRLGYYYPRADKFWLIVKLNIEQEATRSVICLELPLTRSHMMYRWNQPWLLSLVKLSRRAQTLLMMPGSTKLQGASGEDVERHSLMSGFLILTLQHIDTRASPVLSTPMKGKRRGSTISKLSRSNMAHSHLSLSVFSESRRETHISFLP